MLYQNEGIYRYTAGMNWRAAATLLIVVPLHLPGLIHAINPKVPIGNFVYFCTSRLPNSPHCTIAKSRNADKASWLTSFFIAAGVYFMLASLFPATNTYVDTTVESLDEGYAFNTVGMESGVARWERVKEKASSSDEGVFTGSSSAHGHGV